jgi:hypothetical protein
MKTYRQGDVLLVPIEKPEGIGLHGTCVLREPGEGIILAAGEATGHHHRIRDRHARVHWLRGKRILTVCKHGAKLTHEEHETIDLPAGHYEVVQQTEFVPPPPKKRPASIPMRRAVYD